MVLHGFEVRELPPNSTEDDATLPIPASFEFPNGHLEEKANQVLRSCFDHEKARKHVCFMHIYA